MRDPAAGPFAFTKPLPLRDMITMCAQVWDEQAQELRSGGGAGG